jgi:hypothetical protein
MTREQFVTLVLGLLASNGVIATVIAYYLGLPATDPEVAGQLWADSGVLTVSAGSGG